MPFPEAFNGCKCECHTTPGVMHFMACCWPAPPARFPAVKMVHWPTGPVAACDRHANALVNLSSMLGAHVHVALIEPGRVLECTNCVNEAKSAADKQRGFIAPRFVLIPLLAGAFVAATQLARLPTVSHSATVTVLAHAYDGPTITRGKLATFRYTGSAMKVEFTPDGAGIFRSGFERRP